MATATEVKRPKAPAAVLKSVLGPDGKLKHTLPAKEARKLTAARDLCKLLEHVAELQDVAALAKEALESLYLRLCQNSE